MVITLETILNTAANWLVTNINPDGCTATAGLLSAILLGLLILALEETDDKKKRPVIRLALMRDFFSYPLLLFAATLLLFPVFVWPIEQSSGSRPYSTLKSSIIIFSVVSFIVGLYIFFRLLLRLGKWITNPLSYYDVTAQSEAVLKYFRDWTTAKKHYHLGVYIGILCRQAQAGGADFNSRCFPHTSRVMRYLQRVTHMK
jgi:hypothetical protein